MDWRDDFRRLADEIRQDDQPEAVAQLFEHVADLAHGRDLQLQGRPWLREVEELEYDELILASVALTRVKDTAEDSGRKDYMGALDVIVQTLAEEIGRRKQKG